ncbi:hypothetical protein KEM52_000573 [Ascosphaera acerosa]|nr:hypothetical protein KEM52_000573 [Ascosphaera acerosa]
MHVAAAAAAAAAARACKASQASTICACDHSGSDNTSIGAPSHITARIALCHRHPVPSQSATAKNHDRSRSMPKRAATDETEGDGEGVGSERDAAEAAADVASPAPKRMRIEREEDGEGENETSPRPSRSPSQSRPREPSSPSPEHPQPQSQDAASVPTPARVAAGDADSDDDADDRPVLTAPTRQSEPVAGYSDLYLDTIQRSVLDFDFEKLCSVSLSNVNVYACLVCGKYFQGRGPKSHAYFHALDADHHVFVNMETKKVYVLPEGYEVKNHSLDDIRYVVNPTYTKDEVARLDKVVIDAWDITGKKYRPGFVGMNNIKANDYLNVIVQLLAHVRPIRNYFLLQRFSPQATPQLAIRFGTLVRKLWNPKAFRNHVSPHELLQEIALRSSKRFTLTRQSDPVEFLSWFLNQLHVALGGSRKPSPTGKPSSILQQAFQGRLKIESQAITAHSDATNSRLVFSESSVTDTQLTPFLFLTLDLPPTPLFQSSNAEYIIPQVSLVSLLAKYNGVAASEKLDRRLRHRLMHPLPPYLLLHIKRFSRNKFVSERNPTIVTFPSTRGLDLSPYVEPDPAVHPPAEPILYNLVANVILDADVVVPGGADETRAAAAAGAAKGAGAGPASTPANGASSSTAAAAAASQPVGKNALSTAPGVGATERVNWRIQVLDKAMAAVNAREKQQKGPEWLEIQDLFLDKAESETLFTREGYLMVWERQKSPLKKAA